MRKEFDELVAIMNGNELFQKNDEVDCALYNLEKKIDEVEKRMDCAVRSAEEINNSISEYTARVDNKESFVMTIDSHDSILRGSNDVTIALDLNEDMCIKDNWYNLFEPLGKPIAVGNVEYDFPEEVYTIGNADNTEIIADLYESVFDKLVCLGTIICDSDERFPKGGNKTNYVIIDNIFTNLIKNRQIDLSKVPIVEQKKEQYVGAPTMQCLDTHTFDKVKEVIQILKTLDNGNSVDGETMQYILEQVGMKEQVAKQLGLVNF